MVDNASADGSAAMVAAEFPPVRLVTSQENLGFAGGNNLILRKLGFGEAEEQGSGGAEERRSKGYTTHHVPRTTDYAPRITPRPRPPAQPRR